MSPINELHSLDCLFSTNTVDYHYTTECQSSAQHKEFVTVLSSCFNKIYKNETAVNQYLGRGIQSQTLFFSVSLFVVHVSKLAKHGPAPNLDTCRKNRKNICVIPPWTQLHFRVRQCAAKTCF